MDYLHNGSSLVADHGSEVEYRSYPGASRSPSGFAQNVAISTNRVLRSMPAKMRAAIEHDLRRVKAAKEQFLFHQDDKLEYVYFPETAVVSEFHILDDGRMVEVSITGREGVIGVATLYNADRTSNCVQVTQGGTLLRIESELLQRAMRRDRELAYTSRSPSKITSVRSR